MKPTQNAFLAITSSEEVESGRRCHPLRGWPMDEDELSALTVAELKVRLKELGLTTGGKKADLIARLI